MKINLKYIAGLLLVAFTSCSTPLTEEQKNSDSVLLKQTHEYTLNADGSVEYSYYHRRQYNSYMSFHRLYGETFVVYNPNFQTLTLNKSETTMADGKKVQSPTNAFNEVLPFQAADAPAYNHLREMVITHVGLEIGAVVELDYTLHTNAEFSSIFSEKMLLHESSPIKELEVIVRIPKGHTLNHFVVNEAENLRFTKLTQGEFDVYRWSAQNVRALSNEPNQVEGLGDYQTLLFSNKNLAEAVDFIKTAFAKEFVADKTFESLLKSNDKGWALAEAIKNHVAKNMVTYRVSPKHVGYRFRTPMQVWQSNGGNEGEKAILLNALLKEAGFKAELVLAGYPNFIKSEAGSPLAFDKCVVKVEYEGETRYFNSTHDETAIPGSRAIVYLSNEFAALTLEPIQKKALKMDMSAKFELRKDGNISGTATIFANQFEKDKGLISGIPESAFKLEKQSEKSDSVVHKITLTKGFTAEKAGDYLSLSLPFFAQGFSMAHIGELPTSRTTRLELPNALDETYEFTVKLPKGFVAVIPSRSEKLENAIGSIAILYEVNGQEVKVTRKLQVNQAIIPVELYGDFRALVGIWSDKNLNKIIVKPE
jgi:hypothetical protein